MRWPIFEHGKSHWPGRKKVYGEKIRLRELLGNPDSMHTAPSPIYGEINISSVICRLI